MKYSGLEIDNFDKANIWRSYIYFLIKNLLNLKKMSSITLSEMDKDFCKILNNRYKKKINYQKSANNEI